MITCVFPPSAEGKVAIGDARAGLSPSEHLTPDLPKEGASCEDMLHVLKLLVTEHAGRRVGKATTSMAVGRPTSVLQSQPYKDLDV